MTDFAKPLSFDHTSTSFVRELTPEAERPKVFNIPAPVLLGKVELDLLDATVQGLDADGQSSYAMNVFKKGENAFKVYEYKTHEHEQLPKYPTFSQALDPLTQAMLKLAEEGTDNFDMLHPAGHKARFNGSNYELWVGNDSEHASSWRRTYWKKQQEPLLVIGSEESIDFVTGQVSVDDPDLVSVSKSQERTFWRSREKKGAKHTRTRVMFSQYNLRGMEDEQLADKGLEVVTLEPGQVAMVGLGEIIRRRGKHEPSSAFLQLKFERPSYNEYHFPDNK